MEVSNDDIARILGRIEGKLDAQAAATKRVEDGLASLDTKVNKRLDDHDQRIRALETGAAKAGVVAGIGSSVLVATVIELLKRKMGM